MDYLAEVKEIKRILDEQEIPEQEQLNEAFEKARSILKKAWDFVKDKIDSVMFDKVQVAAEKVEKHAAQVNIIASGIGGLRQAGELSKRALTDPSFRDDITEIGRRLRSEVNELLDAVDSLNSIVDKAIQDMEKE